MTADDAARAAATAAAPGTAIGRYRWVVVALLFTAMVINYVDRQALGLLKADLTAEFGWSETDYADLVFWFQCAYAVSYLAWGRIIDKIGARGVVGGHVGLLLPGSGGLGGDREAADLLQVAEGDAGRLSGLDVMDAAGRAGGHQLTGP